MFWHLWEVQWNFPPNENQGDSNFHTVSTPACSYRAIWRPGDKFSELPRRVSGSPPNDLSLTQWIPTRSGARIMWRTERWQQQCKCVWDSIASGVFIADIKLSGPLCEADVMTSPKWISPLTTSHMSGNYRGETWTQIIWLHILFLVPHATHLSQFAAKWKADPCRHHALKGAVYLVCSPQAPEVSQYVPGGTDWLRSLFQIMFTVSTNSEF